MTDFSFLTGKTHYHTIADAFAQIEGEGQPETLQLHSAALTTLIEDPQVTDVLDWIVENSEGWVDGAVVAKLVGVNVQIMTGLRYSQFRVIPKQDAPLAAIEVVEPEPIPVPDVPVEPPTAPVETAPPPVPPSKPPVKKGRRGRR